MSESIKETNMAGKITTGSIDMGTSARKIPAKTGKEFTGEDLIKATPEIVSEILKGMPISLNKAVGDKEAPKIADAFAKIALGLVSKTLIKDSDQKPC